MAVEKRYPAQMPFVGTHTQRSLLERDAGKRRTSIAAVLRTIVDKHYGLVDGEKPEPEEDATDA